VRQRIGMVFQNFELFAHLTALDNIMLAPTKVLGRPRTEAARWPSICWARASA